MPRVRFAMVGVLGVGLLGGCANLEDEIDAMMGDQDREPRTVAFECDDDRDFTARLSGDREEARVDVGDERYNLDLADRDDDERTYTNNNGVRLTISNDEAYLRIPGESDFQDCDRA
jgi:hypothetical protein